MHTNAALIISQRGTFVLFAEKKKQAANVLFFLSFGLCEEKYEKIKKESMAVRVS